MAEGGQEQGAELSTDVQMVVATLDEIKQELREIIREEIKGLLRALQPIPAQPYRYYPPYTPYNPQGPWYSLNGSIGASDRAASEGDSDR